MDMTNVRMTYMPIARQEKKNVYKLDVIRRTMRKLKFSNALSEKYAREVADEYIKKAPHRGTMLRIAHDSLS